ncbi:hypothetical protein ACS0TY_028581 [Phlomoides rotata]
MGECASDWDWLYPEERTMILVGRSGNGKSATGNSIIETNVFDEMPSSACVTTSCRRRATVLSKRRILTMIDTPGSFDVYDEREIMGLETCIHVVLLVVSLIKCFSSKESLVIENLTRFFGAKLSDYMIVVFTHGDALEDEPLDDYLGRNCPDQLAKILETCGNRCVLFDNTTKDESKKSEQQKELLRLVDTVVLNNGGVPYSNELFDDVSENGVKFSKAYEELLLKKIESNLPEMILRVEKQLADEQVARKQSESVALEAQLKSTDINRLGQGIQKKLEMLRKMESKHRETTLRLEKQLEVEKVARVQAEADQMKSNDEISNVREDLERAQREARELQKTNRETKELLKKMIQEKEDEENHKKTNNCPISEITSAIEHKFESSIRERILQVDRLVAKDKTQEVRESSERRIEDVMQGRRSKG